MLKFLQAATIAILAAAAGAITSEFMSGDNKSDVAVDPAETGPKIEILGQALRLTESGVETIVRDVAGFVAGTTGDEMQETLDGLLPKLGWFFGIGIERYTVLSKEAEFSREILFETGKGSLAYVTDVNHEITSLSGLSEPIAHNFRLRPNESIDIVIVGRSGFGTGPSTSTDYGARFSVEGRQLEIAAAQSRDLLKRLARLESESATQEPDYPFPILVLLVVGGAAIAFAILGGALGIVFRLKPEFQARITTADNLGWSLAVFESLSEQSSKREQALKVKEKMIERLKEHRQVGIERS